MAVQSRPRDGQNPAYRGAAPPCPGAVRTALDNPGRRGQTGHVKQAFILGAGLGTRLRPLTDHLPKPLVPLFHKPLAGWAADACAAAGIDRFAVNTHHLPEKWRGFQPPASSEIAFFHEPVLLETGGGLKNIEAWTRGEPLLVHNGDVFSTLPLERLIAAHESSGNMVTLALRSQGEAKHIALDASGSRVMDIRNLLGRAEGTHLFTGIYCVNPAFFELIPAGVRISVIPAFLDLAARGLLGAVTLDEGIWLDLGDRDSYLRAHSTLGLALKIHPLAEVRDGAIVENSVVGPGAVVEPGAVVRDSVLWPGTRICAGAEIRSCIVCSGSPVRGFHEHADI
jgi:mannose-1-phosphate guanylyltransferase